MAIEELMEMHFLNGKNFTFHFYFLELLKASIFVYCLKRNVCFYWPYISIHSSFPSENLLKIF